MTFFFRASVVTMVLVALHEWIPSLFLGINLSVLLPLLVVAGVWSWR